MSKNSVFPLVLGTISSASINNTYQAVNAGGFEASPFLIRITNASNQPITVSYDGTLDNEFVAANTTAEINVQQNAAPPNWVCKFKKGTVVYVKGTAGLGTIAVSAYAQIANSF